MVISRHASRKVQFTVMRMDDNSFAALVLFDLAAFAVSILIEQFFRVSVCVPLYEVAGAIGIVAEFLALFANAGDFPLLHANEYRDLFFSFHVHRPLVFWA